ncbi:uncharacterized protein TM35_000162840 [Trypanosoma theileri]|uniref:Uncharacterized protein n=1 Tax=Trypanosoma theileri TaxID=67003 RepID=A0A1X0NVB8_9TRYP|nr:uncharacterized protein TM35_000162840 [Trypanosoma theileri]ORC88646.1 hypothetical protein TM35_000162840 [Trypanosoma theileri]
MASGSLQAAVVSITAWAAGDFLAQFVAAHREAARRRLASASSSSSSQGGSEAPRVRPTAAQMAAMVDGPRIAAAALFGAFVALPTHHFRRAARKSRGPTAAAVLFTLSLQQFLLTPLTLLAYYNAATALRGGFADPAFLRAYETDVHAGGRYDAFSVERRILVDVMPNPLIASWGVFAPLAFLNYTSGRPVRGVYAAFFLIPWTAYVSYTQSTQLL